jgi:hypothetical protein
MEAEPLSSDDVVDINRYLQKCSDAALRGIFAAEQAAGRTAIVALVQAEIERRRSA